MPTDPNSLNLSGQVQDPAIVRENFNKIAKYITAMDSAVIRLQSEPADLSSIGGVTAIKTFTVFMQSDTDACSVTIPDPKVFALSVIDKKDTLWFFKGISGGNTKTITISGGGTIEGNPSKTITNDQTICIQSNGEEYKILFDSTSGGSGGGRFGIEDTEGTEAREFDSTGSFTQIYTNPSDETESSEFDFLFQGFDFYTVGDGYTIESGGSSTSKAIQISVRNNTTNHGTTISAIKESDVEEVNAKIQTDDFIKLQKGFTSTRQVAYDKIISNLINKDILVIDNTDDSDGEAGKVYRISVNDLKTALGI